MRPLPGRDCGPCNACCMFMPIVAETLVKPTNVLCPHCTDGIGCGVYAQRPSICAEWECGWRVMRQIPAGWRPNESGLVFRVEDVLDDEITITVLDARPPLLSDDFAALITAWHEAGVKLYLQTVGPPGMYPSRRHINPELADATASGDPSRLRDAFINALNALRQEHVWVADSLALASRIEQS